MPVIMKDNVQYAYTTKGTVFHTLSNAEYEALPESEKMNGDVYCIPDREPILNPDQVWAKIGTETLDIGDDLTDGVNQLNSSLNSFSTWKTWQPQLYDYNTYKRDFSSTNGDYKYLEIGSLVIAYINVNNQDYSGISTMLQVRNLPMETVLSGICYFAGNAASGADKVIQMVGGSNQLYPRPNMTSAYFSNPTSSGWTSIIIFGAK